MSIGKRLFNMARSELNSLLDRAAESDPRVGSTPDPDEDLYRRFSLDQLSDAELEAEIERRHRARSAAKGQAARASSGSARASSGSAPRQSTAEGTGTRPAGRPASAGPRPASPGQAKKPTPSDQLRQAYAALEVPFGADFATVRKAYRALMRKYHPDRHTGSPEKQKAATELAQKLSSAYELIEKQGRH